MKKVLKGFVILLLASLFTNAFFAEDELYTENDLQYMINNNRIEITYYYGKDTTYTIPWSIGDYQIEDFKDGAFNNSDVTTIKVPDYLYDYSTGEAKINVRSYNPGIIFIFYDAFGNEVATVDTSLKNEIENPLNDMIHEEDPIIKTLDDNVDSPFEEKEITILDEEFEDTGHDSQEGFINQVAKRIRDTILFNGGQFASNFAKNPIGYIIIIISVAALIYIFIRYIKRR